MNERIQELMRQSMVEYQFDLRFSPEKFAQLIVRECAGVAFEHAPSDESAFEISSAIEQHFGVE